MKKRLAIAALFSSVLSLSVVIKAQNEIINITSKGQLDNLLKKDFVVLKFKAEWCPACQAAREPFEKLANKFPNVHFANIDTDANPQISKKYNVQAIPFFKLIKKGKDVHNQAGFPGIEQLIKNKLLK